MIMVSAAIGVPVAAKSVGFKAEMGLARWGAKGSERFCKDPGRSTASLRCRCVGGDAGRKPGESFFSMCGYSLHSKAAFG